MLQRLRHEISRLELPDPNTNPVPHATLTLPPTQEIREVQCWDEWKKWTDSGLVGHGWVPLHLCESKEEAKEVGLSSDDEDDDDEIELRERLQRDAAAPHQD